MIFSKHVNHNKIMQTTEHQKISNSLNEASDSENGK